MPIIRSLDLEIQEDAADSLSQRRIVLAGVSPARNIPETELSAKTTAEAFEEASALEAVLSDWSQGHRQRARAARALGPPEENVVAKALIEALEDDCPAIRQMAIAALGEMGGEEAASRLKELLKSSSRHARWIADRVAEERRRCMETGIWCLHQW